MSLTRIALSNPVAVAVGCILLVIFGLISLSRLPIQMTPDIERPSITVSTAWRAAAPAEVESEILEPQEALLRDVPGLERMVATAGQGSGSISLEFKVGTDINRVLIEVINRLNQVQRYPVDASEPTIRVGDEDFAKTIAWFSIRRAPGNQRNIAEFQDFVDQVVKERIERIPGISSATPRGGRPYEIRISFDPFMAANIGVDLSRIGQQLGDNNDVSGGFREMGRRSYTLRFAGRYEVADMQNLVLDWREGNPVYLGDVATVERVMRDRRALITHNAEPTIAMNVVPEPGVNVLEVMSELKAVVAELERTHINPAGLEIKQLYDDTIYITQSIRMVATNLILGMLLAIAVLWWFFRRFRATMMVALAIPLCLLFSFLVLDGANRTLNVISLAGLAFAVGMVLDAAIVVLENIVRRREAGEDIFTAALRGTGQVWGALLASTATTVAIFLPVIFLQDEAGQLFADLAVVISAAIICSLLVAITVLPTAAWRLLGERELKDRHADWWDRGTGVIMQATDGQRRRWAWIGGLTVIPVLIGALLIPPADYLPEGQRNFLFGFLVTPPGLGVETAEAEIVTPINERMRPLLLESGDNGEDGPRIEDMFMGFFGGGIFFGAVAEDPKRFGELLGFVNGYAVRGIPDTFGGANRAPLFIGRGGRSIQVDLQAADFEELLAAGQVGFMALNRALPGANVRPLPGLELAEPELRLIPDDRRIAEAGWTRNQVATALRALGDGTFLGDYFDGDRRLDIVLRREGWTTPEELMSTPLATPRGDIKTLGELARLEQTAGPNQIRRVDRRRTLSLLVTPPSDMPLETALDIISEQVSPQIRAALPADGVITYRGTAEALGETLRNLSGSFLLAVVILYLLISALFRSFRDSVLVLLTLPMATVGGIIGLRLAGLATGQAMDMLTMIGFIILLGLVVNNAILLVHRAREGERDGLGRREAVETAVRQRLRPILMSTTTSLFGMLPLLLMPGAGTEVYRGLAAVIVGGMAVSTLFTLILLPSLLRLREEVRTA
ncbi:efflux RND transporter permease subunit [Natronospira bacteriovora]|uniref:Efflux RND transporter permease subunit n=1 Tax=Natronospira bacteriovora TaxID=3069753 RepID=A0ABU0W818_9GAMM|nr:efflux RND transporter permease subunit [Natronospira sp. AB-CW4]MDQ2070097.1 efflux RND transporter permease subunit [Natronospira sp. AB-CW4]